MSNYKELAKHLFYEEENQNIQDALISIAQEVLELHIDKSEDEFNPTLMPPPKVLPNITKSYEKIETLIKKALNQGEEDIEEVL